MFSTGKDPDIIIKNRGLEQISDESLLEPVIDEVIRENPGPVEELKGGNEKAIGFLIGRIMAKTRGKANPYLVNEIIRKKIG